MMSELIDAITRANGDVSIGAIVLTGSGRGFCAGADIEGEFAAQLDRADNVVPNNSVTNNAVTNNAVPNNSVTNNAVTNNADTKSSGIQPETPASRDWVALVRSSKPLIAAINGPAIGVGLTMVLPFDRIIAASNAKLSARFVKLGLVPELASSHFLVVRCGWGAASWLALSGITIDGTEGARIGLVDRAVEAGTALEEAMREAEVLANNPAPQMRMIKQLLTVNSSEVDLGEVQRRELSALQIAYQTPEHREAVQAFLEKRPPVFGTPPQNL